MNVLPLSEADATCGGKAHGLRRLMDAGLRVPTGLVVTDVPPEPPAEEVLEAWRRLGAPAVAVRSSATSEDGAQASAAGQFESFLGIESPAALAEALRRCAASLHGGRAEVYRERFHREAAQDDRMNIVVQRMVPGAVSGVLFTVEPTKGPRRDAPLLVEACAGGGDALMSGHAQAVQYRLRREGPLPPDGDALLPPQALARLREEALRAERHFGHPLDLEWTLGADGTLHWLQARPITGLHRPGPDEFDYLPDSPREFFTRANIGEMLPGAATPLTMEVFGDALDYAMRRFYGAIGAIDPRRGHQRFACVFGGHMFLNLSALYQIVGRVAGTSSEALEVSILGRELASRPEVRPIHPVGRLVNFARYLGFVWGHHRAERRMERLRDSERVALHSSASPQLAEIRRFLPHYHEVMALHMQVSAWSGALNGGLRTVLARAGLSKQEQMDAIGTLLSDIDGIESAQIIKDLQAIAQALRPAAAAGELTAETLGPWLRKRGAQEAPGRLFADFLARNGHRSVREVELRELEWAEEPADLLHTLWGMATAPAPPSRAVKPSWEEALESLCEAHPGISRGALRYLTPRARSAVVGREHGKSILIRMTRRLKIAVRRLAEMLRREGVLSDPDLIYFFTLSELDALVRGAPEKPRPETARIRREHLERQMDVTYPDFCQGIPRPVIHTAPAGGQTVFAGMGVSPGVARGPVRVVRTLKDARGLRHGEILCARFTDVGWTPYYGIAAGLITEIGSSLSHGAVVAREYGLPLVTNVEGVTSLFETGDFIELDGAAGTVTRVAPSEAHGMQK